MDFTEAEEQMALNSVNRNLDSYEQLRKLNIPLDTEPALATLIESKRITSTELTRLYIERLKNSGRAARLERCLYAAIRRRGRQARTAARNAMYATALDVFRTAGAKLEPMAMPEFPNQAIGFVLSAEAAAAFDDLTRRHPTM